MSKESLYLSTQKGQKTIESLDSSDRDHVKVTVRAFKLVCRARKSRFGGLKSLGKFKNKFRCLSQHGSRSSAPTPDDLNSFNLPTLTSSDQSRLSNTHKVKKTLYRRHISSPVPNSRKLRILNDNNPNMHRIFAIGLENLRKRRTMII